MRRSPVFSSKGLWSPGLIYLISRQVIWRRLPVARGPCRKSAAPSPAGAGRWPPHAQRCACHSDCSFGRVIGTVWRSAVTCCLVGTAPANNTSRMSCSASGVVSQRWPACSMPAARSDFSHAGSDDRARSRGASREMGGGSVRMGQACSSGHTFVAFNSLLIEPGKPDQSLHRIVQRALPGWGLNEYWLISLRHAQIVIAA